MNYTLKPTVARWQFMAFIRDAFPELTEDDINDLEEFFFGYPEEYTEIHFVNNDEDLSTVDEDEFEIFANVNKIYEALRGEFAGLNGMPIYDSILVITD